LQERGSSCLYRYALSIEVKGVKRRGEVEGRLER
jgi:hypothetical protein